MDDDDEDDVVEMDAPARRTRGAVKSGRVVKPQSKGKGKAKAKAKVVGKKTTAPSVKKQKELSERLAEVGWRKKMKAKGRGKNKEMVMQEGWEDDRWADVTPW